MNARRPSLPGWAQRHLLLTLGLILLLAVFVRTPAREASLFTRPLSGQNLPVAAAIGLTEEIPTGDALATYVNAALYSAQYSALSIISPGISTVDFCANFLGDPGRFAALSRFAALTAVLLAVAMFWVLMRRLLDPVSALAAALLIAVHPSLVALSQPSGSGAFALLLIIAALLVASEFARRTPRHLDLAAIGLCLGFAVEIIPAAVAALCLIALFIAYRVPRSNRPEMSSVAIGIVCFSGASAAILPYTISIGEAIPAIALGALAAVAISAGFQAIMVLRRSLAPQVYSSSALAVAVLTSAWAVNNVHCSADQERPQPAVAAAEWVVQNLPENAAVIVHPAISEQFAIPRNMHSWKRELSSGLPNSHSQLFLLAAARSAAVGPGPSWDVRVSREPVDHAREIEQFLVFPDSFSPSADDGDDYWLVARFRSHDGFHQGVTIWGTGTVAASTEAAGLPHWLVTDAGRLARHFTSATSS